MTDEPRDPESSESDDSCNGKRLVDGGAFEWGTDGPSRRVLSGWRRFVGTVRVAGGRVRGRLFGGRPGRTLFSVLGVVVAVALMTTVTGIAIGLTTQQTVASEDVDYWIVPEGTAANSVLVEPGEAGLGSVHPLTAELNDDPRVEYATPVLLQVLRLRNTETGTAKYVLTVGIIPPDDGRAVAGLPTRALSTSSPHYANGTYSGEWTGEAVAASATATVLDVDTGGQLSIETGDSDRTLSVVDVADPGENQIGMGPIPIVIVHLAELQTVTDTTRYDQADQILVSTNDERVASALRGLYPETDVISRTGLAGGVSRPGEMSLAVGLSAFIVAVTVGTLFVATMMGLEVSADRRRHATLGALGLSGRTRGVLVAAEIMVIAALGGLVGVGVGWLGIAAVNRAASTLLGVESIATFSPWLLAYGVAVALAIGVLAVPYPVWVSRTASNLTEELR